MGTGGGSGTFRGDRYASRTRQARNLGAGVEVHAPTMANDDAASVIAGARTTEIDSPHFRGRRRLNRRVHLILPQNPSTDVNAWEFAGIDVGIESESGNWTGFP